jgi:hypothetical protein
MNSDLDKPGLDDPTKTTKYNNWFFYVLAISIVIGFFTVLIVLIIKGGLESTVNIVIGALVGAFLSVVGYFFGTNKSSEAKTAMIYNSTPIRNGNLPNPNLPNPNLITTTTTTTIIDIDNIQPTNIVID